MGDMFIRISCGKLMAFGNLLWTAAGRPTDIAAASDRDRGARRPVAVLFCIFVGESGGDTGVDGEAG